jgi:tetratricopeptide (TPR) repeat protein
VGLKLISSRTEAEGAGRIRERELEAGRLVLRAVASVGSAAGASLPEFMVRRARASVERMERSPARAALGRAVNAVADVAADEAERRAELRQALVCYGGVLERHCVWPAAVEAYETARVVAPLDPEVMLHLARAHRLSGSRAAALELYRAVREVSADARLVRFAEVGGALLAADAVAALTAVLDPAGATVEPEVCAVALEERARLHRNASRTDEAVADYIAAAQVYERTEDCVRIAHALADLMLARGDLAGAREAMYLAHDVALPAQRANVVHRLRAVARAQGDEIGLRRWPSARPASFVSLIGPRRAVTTGRTHAPLLRNWRDQMAVYGARAPA